MTESDIAVAITNTLTPFAERLEKKIDESDERSNKRVEGLRNKMDAMHKETQTSITAIKVSAGRMEERFDAHERNEERTQGEFKDEVRDAIKEGATDRRGMWKMLAGGGVSGGIIAGIIQAFTGKGGH